MVGDEETTGQAKTLNMYEPWTMDHARATAEEPPFSDSGAVRTSPFKSHTYTVYPQT